MWKELDLEQMAEEENSYSLPRPHRRDRKDRHGGAVRDAQPESALWGGRVAPKAERILPSEAVAFGANDRANTRPQRTDGKEVKSWHT